MSTQIIEQTGDGSTTIRNVGSGVTYHSVHGAIDESMHVFINAGLDCAAKNKTSLSILEMGLGTGLNALLTYRYSIENNISVYYEAIEKFPLRQELVSQLNYCSMDNMANYNTFFTQMHKSEWQSVCVPGKKFEIKKRNEDIIEAELNNKFDLVYFDAFDPVHQPGLWTKNVFQKIYDACNENAVLVTYSSKGDVRRALAAAGFAVEKLKGAPGKREMVRAMKSATARQ